MSEISQLYEKIKPELIDENNLYQIQIVDGMTQQKINEHHAEVELDDPFHFDPSRFIPDTELINLEKFAELASDIIKDAQTREGVVESEQVKLVQEYQPEEFHLLGDELISFRVLKREPAKMNRQVTSMTQRSSGFDYDIRSSDQPNKIITIESRPIDHNLEFGIWAKTATLANKRALWLERLFVTHAWAFQVKGIERFFWSNRGPDTVWKHAEQRMHQRTLQFFMRLREFEVKASPRIAQFNFNFQIAT